jgi:hypothetical protein
MSYTNQDPDSSTDAIRSNIQGKSGGQYSSDIGGTDGRPTGVGTTAAERSYGGSDQLSDPSYSGNGDRVDDGGRGRSDRQGTEYDRVRAGDPDQVSDPAYSQNADQLNNASSGGAKGGTQYGASGDPNTFSTTGATSTAKSGNTYGSAGGDEYGSGNTYGSSGGGDDADVGGYGKTDTYRRDTTDPSGGQGVGTGSTRYGQQRSDVRAGDNAYGNLTSDVGGQAAPLGGANDPAYQPGSRYSYGQDGVVDEDSGNNYAGGKVGLGDKIKGTLEKVEGKITKNPGLVQQGEDRKTGNLGSTGNTDPYGSAGQNTTSGNQYGQSGNTDY